jgi:molybdenum-dependent DNA-binding transcriptional regulator ModE
MGTVDVPIVHKSSRPFFQAHGIDPDTLEEKGGGQQGGGSAAGKTATVAHIKEYAATKKITEAAARKEFEDAGYTVK